MAPLVSAVTIVSDGERFLAEAIESVLGQTYSNLELVIVDDGSTDRSAEIAERFVRAAPDRVRLVRHVDGGTRGMSAARAFGVRTTQGELIGFLDADDVWLPEKIVEQVAVLEAHPTAGMVYGRTQMWHSWDSNTARSDYFYDLGVEPDRLYPPLRLVPKLLENRAQSPTTGPKSAVSETATSPLAPYRLASASGRAHAWERSGPEGSTHAPARRASAILPVRVDRADRHGLSRLARRLEACIRRAAEAAIASAGTDTTSRSNDSQ